MLEPMEHERRLHLYRQGLNDREIAERLYLTPEAITIWRRASKLPAHNQHRKAHRRWRRKCGGCTGRAPTTCRSPGRLACRSPRWRHGGDETD